MTHSSPCLPSAFGRTPGMSRQGKMASLPALLPSLMAIISPWKFFHEYDGLGAGKRNLQKGRASHSSAVLERRGAAAHRRRAIGARSFPGLALWLLATLRSQTLVKIQSTGPEFHSFAYLAGPCFRCKVEGDHHSSLSLPRSVGVSDSIVAVRCAGLCAQGGGGGGGQGNGG